MAIRGAAQENDQLFLEQKLTEHIFRQIVLIEQSGPKKPGYKKPE